MAAAPEASGPTTSTTHGAVRGRHRRGVELYAGIPYAGPPDGAARFGPPTAAEPWSGVRDAARFSPAAPQLPGEGLTNSIPVPWDEAACLTVNVTTPAADGGARPVLVWIHGGDFRTGTGATPWYDGTNFAANGDIVVVSLNYRLGALGFTRLDPGTGVMGLLDQVAALEWVRDNIASFGGDPSRVTLAGESAGAFSVAALLAMPEATGLFQQAVIQSGGGHHVHTPDDALGVADLLRHEAATDDLRSVPAERLLEAQQRVEARAARELGITMSPFYPSTGSDHLPARPIDLVAAGASADVPVLIGTNADEATLFGVGALTDDRLARWVGRFHPDPDDVIDVYRRARPSATAGELAVAISTDWTFRVPSIELAEARAPSPTWMYLFDWKSRAFDGALGATHALEIPFVFDNLDRPGVDGFLGPGPVPQHVADAMHRCWTAFVRHGDPGADGIPDWPAYRSDDRCVLVFADDCELVSDPAADERSVWSGVR